MKTTTRYAADIATNMENEVRHMQAAPRLAMHSAIPTKDQELNRYTQQLLTRDEQTLCDIATD